MKFWTKLLNRKAAMYFCRHLTRQRLPHRTPRCASCGWTGRARAPEGAQDARTLPAAAPGAHAKYDLGVGAVPDKLGHMYEMPDPVLLWQSVLAFAERGPEHRDPQFYMRHGDVENCESQ